MKLETRRDLLKSLAALGLMGFMTTAAFAKGTKKQSAYQDSPKNGETCKNCVHFLSKTNECKLVEGSIASEGWCNLYNDGKAK
ncbi:MAG: high-potential iron-sulfur protein [Arcobacteraceae bacterium]|jgi:hypothetical protein|nr:high-potential iron-sulfur protein [Arcobacteraceae bacterium]MDY0328041.1 high-potential iron-sulfur protein [Arcobacteraceae bacterium]